MALRGLFWTDPFSFPQQRIYVRETAFPSFPWLLPTTDQSGWLILKTSVNRGYSILCLGHCAVPVSLEYCYFIIAGTMRTVNFIPTALAASQNSAS